MSELFEPFTAPWADALRVVINDDERYQAEGKKFGATLALVLEQESPLAVLLELADGACIAATIVSAGETTAKFVFRAPRDVWRALAADELDPLTALTQKKIAMTGNLVVLMMHHTAIRALLDCARRVPTRF